MAYTKLSPADKLARIRRGIVEVREFKLKDEAMKSLADFVRRIENDLEEIEKELREK